MFVLICATLLFSVRRITAATGGSTTWCIKDYCITVREGEIEAEAGLCVVIPCSFTTDPTFTPKHLLWYKCGPFERRCVNSNMIFHSNKSSKDVQAGFMGRVSLLEPYEGLNNCSIIINDLTESDSGSYRLRVKGAIDGRENGVTFKQKVNISVKGLTQKPTVGIPPLTEGQQTTLSCTAPALCSGSDPEITWTWRGAGEKDSPITGSITAVKTQNLTSVTRRRSSTLTFNPSAEHHGTNVTCKVSFTNNITTEETVMVTYMKKPLISGNTAVKEGDVFNLTCSADSFPPSRVTWTKLFFNESLPIKNVLHNVSGTATLLIHNVTAEYSGQYVCTAEQRITNVTTAAEVTVTFVPKFSNQCSTVEAEKNLKDLLYSFFISFTNPHVLIAFLMGILLSATICCLALKCCRKKKKKNSGGMDLQIVTTQVVPLMDPNQAADSDGTHGPEGDVQPREVEYSDIDFSLVKRKSVGGAEGTQETPDTEYAEINNKGTEERQSDGAEDSEMMEGREEEGEKEEEEAIGGDEETEECVLKEEGGGEDDAVYSNVHEVMVE
ncbi:sialic acid-binding Ig-like lectin 12 [Pungitius pungitius]|uniref:sialic acid-binding Ig-like lectin 12 n=1 Tax=Pungitius pungitius TaxID=134920 RepID=UPI002E14CDC9